MENKPFKSIDEMCCLLIQDRGLICPDDNELRKFLSRTNYYRFSGYARDFQEDPEKGKNSFIGNTSFQDINKLINLDAKLRILLTEQLSVIEIAIRAKLAHQHYSKESFNTPYEKYHDVPIWVAVEVLSFGRISNMISYSDNIEVTKRVAKSLGVQWKPFSSVVHSLHVLRNLCAHHRQLWNRPMRIQCPVQKKLRPKDISFDPKSVYAHILMANYYRKAIDGDTSVARRIQELLDKNNVFAKGIYLLHPK
ncbi:MAG: Abi family protein [Atopobium sp.]|nr:Abi family protein [Atopobium sp.]